jgi:hypothetical protein
MGEAARRIRPAVLTALLALGCAGTTGLGWDGVVSLEQTVPPDPESGDLVRLARIADHRVFRRVSHARTTPSLPWDLMDDEQIRARVLGRRRENQGGSLLVPEGESVATWVEDAVTTALRNNGLRVIRGAGYGSEAEGSVAVGIEELWAFVVFEPSGVAKLEMRIRLLFEGPGAFEGGLEACGRAMRTSGGESKAVWTALVRDAFADLVVKVGQRVAFPGRSPDPTCTPSHQ